MEKEIAPLPGRGQRLTRIGLAAIAALALLWLPVEDTNPLPAQLIAAGLCLAGGLHLYFRRDDRPLGRWRLAGGGLLVGMAAAPLATLLMIFKNGLHSHSGPDFGPAALAGVLVQTPLWALGGALIAAGLHPFLARK